MADNEIEPWLLLTIKDTDGAGVELPKLGRLLGDISAAFYAIAREKLGMAPTRPGPRTGPEDVLASLRLKRLEPGSAVLELVPPADGVQASLEFQANSDDVAFEFVQELKRIAAGEPAPTGRAFLRRQVRSVITDAAEIGSLAEVAFRPRTQRTEFETAGALDAVLRVRDVQQEEPASATRRSRRVVGHAYMVDVEPGKQRVRLRLTEGRDLTVEFDENRPASEIAAALDHPVEIEVEEEMSGDVAARRIARSVNVLPSAGITVGPPKSIIELMREQNLPKTRPDYVALATEVWGTEDELEEFENHLRETRRLADA